MLGYEKPCNNSVEHRLSDEFEESVKAQKKAHAAEVLRDQYNDMSGVNVGRMARTIMRGDNLDSNGRKRKNTFDLVDLVLSTEEYRAYHGMLIESAGTVRAKADDLSDKIENAIQAAEQRLQAGLDNAVTLPDGRKAFLDTETGIAWADDGEQLDAAFTAGIDWQGKTTLQENQKNEQDLETLRGYQGQVEGIILDISDAQNTLDDTKDGGLSRDGMDAIQGRLDGSDNQLDSISAGVDKIMTLPQAPSQIAEQAPLADLSNLPSQ